MCCTELWLTLDSNDCKRQNMKSNLKKIKMNITYTFYTHWIFNSNEKHKIPTEMQWIHWLNTVTQGGLAKQRQYQTKQPIREQKHTHTHIQCDNINTFSVVVKRAEFYIIIILFILFDIYFAEKLHTDLIRSVGQITRFSLTFCLSFSTPFSITAHIHSVFKQPSFKTGRPSTNKKRKKTTTTAKPLLYFHF